MEIQEVSKYLVESSHVGEILGVYLLLSIFPKSLDMTPLSAAGKEASHLNVGYLVSLNRVLEGLGNALYPCIHVGTFVSVEVNVPVAFYIQLAVFILEEMCGRKLIYVLEKCFVGGGVLECKIVFQRRSVQLLDELGVNKERLYL